MRRDAKWLGAGALAVAAAVAVVAAGALSAPASDAGEDAAAPAARAEPVEVLGARGVPALSGDDGSFAEALASFLGQEGERTGPATVVPDPEEPDGGAFYASAGGLWYSCEAVESASGWAFSALGPESPVAAATAGDHDPGGGREPPAQEAPAPATAAGGAQADARQWVPVSDGDALAGAVGSGAASQLAEAMAGYARAKGIGFDPASARVDASSVRAEPGGVGFEADTGSAMLDVVYSNGEYGFKVI